MRRLWKIVGLGVLLSPAAAFPAETITYTYDTLGRLVQVLHTGSINNNLQANYAYDDADNRNMLNVTGSPNPPP